MSLIPSDKFEPHDALDHDALGMDALDHDELGIDSIRAEVVRNDHVTANVSPINAAAPTRRSRAAADRMVAGAERISGGGPDRTIQAQAPPQPETPRISGSPLPVGNGGLKASSTARNAAPGRTLASPADGQEDISTTQKTLNTLKQALPLIQKLLPLLDGNIVAAVGNLLALRQPSPQKLDLAPLESHLTEMQLMHHDLRGTVTEQSTGLRRVEDQLEMVKEATDRNTLEQQELMEDLRSIGSKVNLFAAILFGILIVSLVLNLLLFMHIKQVLP